MKRLTTLALLVFALAAVPAALADDTTPAAPRTAPAAQQQNRGGHPGVRMRLEIMRLRVQLVSLRFRVHCAKRGDTPSDACKTHAEKALERLTAIDDKVQAKIAELKGCTPDSADPSCKNAERKIAVLTKVDAKLQALIARIQAWLDGKTPQPSPTTSDSSLDQAASQLGALVGSNG